MEQKTLLVMYQGEIVECEMNINRNNDEVVYNVKFRDDVYEIYSEFHDGKSWYTYEGKEKDIACSILTAIILQPDI